MTETTARTQLSPAAPRLPEHVSVLVVGAGFGGLAMAIKLAEAGRDDFLVLERGSDVGGTWRDNTYPGAACDVPSQLYSYSFALNPDWSRSFSPQPEIQAYIKKVGRPPATLDRFAFDTALERATWDEAAGHWKVRTSPRRADRGRGGLGRRRAVRPEEPRHRGLRRLRAARCSTPRGGTTTTTWPASGSPSSAPARRRSRSCPRSPPRSAHLDVYQRTAPWVIPRNDRAYTGDREGSASRCVPGLQRLYRTAIYWGREMYVAGFTKNPKLAGPPSSWR